MEHKHHGKSSSKFLNADEILSKLNLTGVKTFIDAGCGDGYISKKQLKIIFPAGKFMLLMFMIKQLKIWMIIKIKMAFLI